MTKDIEREAFEEWIKSNYPISRLELLEKHSDGGYQHRATRNMFDAWQAAKAHDAEKLKGCVVVPVWIATDFMLPDEGEAVLFIDEHNVIHDGFLSTDYVDGPYGENGEDFGDNQTLWTSNSNGEELIQSKVKYWMARPDIQVKEPKADTEG